MQQRYDTAATALESGGIQRVVIEDVSKREPSRCVLPRPLGIGNSPSRMQAGVQPEQTPQSLLAMRTVKARDLAKLAVFDPDRRHVARH